MTASHCGVPTCEVIALVSLGLSGSDGSLLSDIGEQLSSMFLELPKSASNTLTIGVDAAFICIGTGAGLEASPNSYLQLSHGQYSCHKGNWGI